MGSTKAQRYGENKHTIGLSKGCENRLKYQSATEKTTRARKEADDKEFPPQTYSTSVSSQRQIAHNVVQGQGKISVRLKES